MRPHSFLLSAFLAAAPAAAQILPSPLELATALHGPVGGVGDLVVYETTFGRALAPPTWGHDLRLLDIDFVGRTQLEELLPDRPRRRAALAGTVRLDLPEGRGQLYKYERLVAGTSWFGFLWIGPDGRPRQRAELPGIGGVADPFVPRIAVDPTGRRLLVATLPAAGGDLLDVEVRSGRVVNRTANEAPLTFSDAGLWLAPTWGFGVGAEGVWRFSLGDISVATRVVFPADADPSFYSGQGVCSPARTFAAVTAGDAPTALHVFAFSRKGAAVRVTELPAALSGAGFLPESLHGPYLGVSDDGKTAAWRVEAAVSREVRLAPVASVPQQSVEISADQYYLDTLDELGQIDMRFQPAGGVRYAIGELGGGGVIEKIDVFSARLDATGTPVFQNLTLSSGDAVPPFGTPGTITPEVDHLLPGGAGRLLYDSADDTLYGLRADGAVLVLDPVTKEVQVVEVVGDEVFLGLRHSNGNKPGVPYRLPLDLSSGLVVLPGGGPDVEFMSALGDGVDTVAVVRDTNGVASLVRIDVGTGQLETWGGAGPFEGLMAWDRQRTLLFGEGAATGNVSLQVWPRSRQPLVLQGPLGGAVLVH